MRRLSLLITVTILLTLFIFETSQAVTIDFEGLEDLTQVTDQYTSLGVEFSGATVLTAGISLNEFEFPPNSGTNVVFDEMGPIYAYFDTPVIEVGAYFTYLFPITITAFDFSAAIVDTVTSTYFSNLALSGDPGSTPNEFLQVANSTGISYIEIAGDFLGSSFTMDDLYLSTPSTTNPTPEPATFVLLGSGLLGIIGMLRRRKLKAV